MPVDQPFPRFARYVTSKWVFGPAGLAILLTLAAVYYCGLSLRDLAKPNDYAELEALGMLSDPNLQTKLIRTGEADYRFNCHGWTFTHGEREVDADEVERRLAEEYQPTRNPQLGDIIVYRDHRGQVMHSGVVKAVGEGGLVLVESKWGASGRFIHEPDVGRTFASHRFYHKVSDLAKTAEAKALDKNDGETVEATGDDD